MSEPVPSIVRDAVIAYMGDQWPAIRDAMPPDEHEAFLDSVAETTGFQAWLLTGTHDNPVARTIRAYQDALLREIWEEEDE